jgi:hypothetical protein
LAVKFKVFAKPAPPIAEISPRLFSMNLRESNILEASLILIGSSPTFSSSYSDSSIRLFLGY